MQLADHFTQAGRIFGLYLASNALDEGPAYRAILVARQLRSIGTVRLSLVDHVKGCRQNSEDATLLRPLPSAPQIFYVNASEHGLADQASLLQLDGRCLATSFFFFWPL